MVRFVAWREDQGGEEGQEGVAGSSGDLLRHLQGQDASWGQPVLLASWLLLGKALDLFSELPRDGEGRVIQVCSAVDTAS